MSEQWVSTGKRFCEICKVWYGNNRASQDHHERGERHKAMLQQRIRETMQKGKKQELADMKLNGTLAKMGAAAAASMARHGEGVVAGPSLPSTGLRMNIFDPSQHKNVASMAKEMAARREAGALKRGLSGASAPICDPSAAKITKDDVVSAYRDLTNPNAAGPALPEHLAVGYMPENQVQCAEIAWVRAKAPEGHTYYWNLFDNSTRWDAPMHFYTEQQYEEKCREFEENRKKNYYGLDEVQAVRSGKKDVESYIKEQLEQNGLKDLAEKNRKEQNYVDRPRKGLKLTKAERKAAWEERKKEKEERRRKWEEESEKQKDEVAKEEDGDSEDDVDDEEDSDSDSNSEEDMDDEEIFEIVGTPEREAMDDDEIALPPPKEAPEAPEEPKKPIPAAPYGSWVKITQEEKSSTPFESPLTARFRAEEAERIIEEERRKEEEPKFEFGEKTAAVMTKKVKGPIEFKRKGGNRSIRKREE
uniref:WW domain-containing protein n=2 Tax=Caenorhabditis japonica TaxID=281687 RepID=A0A8R1DSX5_CAEJA